MYMDFRHVKHPVLLSKCMCDGVTVLLLLCIVDGLIIPASNNLISDVYLLIL